MPFICYVVSSVAFVRYYCLIVVRRCGERVYIPVQVRGKRFNAPFWQYIVHVRTRSTGNESAAATGITGITRRSLAS